MTLSVTLGISRFPPAALTIGLLGSCKKEDSTVSVMGVTLDKTTLTSGYSSRRISAKT